MDIVSDLWTELTETGSQMPTQLFMTLPSRCICSCHRPASNLHRTSLVHRMMSVSTTGFFLSVLSTSCSTS